MLPLVMSCAFFWQLPDARMKSFAGAQMGSLVIQPGRHERRLPLPALTKLASDDCWKRAETTACRLLSCYSCVIVVKCRIQVWRPACSCLA